MRPLDPRLLPLLRPASPSLTGVVAAQVVGGALLVAQAFAVAHLLVVVARGQVDRVPLAAALTVLVVAARSLASYVADRCAARASSTVGSHLRRRLVRAVLDLPADRLSQQRGGELALLVTRGVSAVDPYLTRYLPALVVALVLPPLTLVAIGSQDLLSAAIVVATLPLVPLFAALVGLATRDRAEQQWQSLGSLAGHFVDVVRGLPTLVVHRRARAQSATIRRVTDEHRRATLATLRLAFASSAVLELVATLSVALVAVTVGVRLAGGSLDLGTALVVLLLAPEAYWPLRRVGAEFHAAAEGTATLTEAQDLFDAVPSVPPATADPARSRRLDRPHPARPARRASRPPHTRPWTCPARPSCPRAAWSPSPDRPGCGKSTLLARARRRARPGDRSRHRGGPSPGRLGAPTAVAGGPHGPRPAGGGPARRHRRRPLGGACPRRPRTAWWPACPAAWTPRPARTVPGSPAASAPGWRWPGRSSRGGRWSSSTSRPRTSTPPPSRWWWTP